jgi:predicted HD phosphohydrolase
MSVSAEILAIFHARGAGAYFGESVSITEHALQAAYFAQAAGAPPALIVAALLHDIGHLLEDVSNDLADWTADAHHELIGGHWLAKRFHPEVSEPVRLHVPAKRFLLAVPWRPTKWRSSRTSVSTRMRCASGNGMIKEKCPD